MYRSEAWQSTEEVLMAKSAREIMYMTNPPLWMNACGALSLAFVLVFPLIFLSGVYFLPTDPLLILVIPYVFVVKVVEACFQTRYLELKVVSALDSVLLVALVSWIFTRSPDLVLSSIAGCLVIGLLLGTMTHLKFANGGWSTNRSLNMRFSEAYVQYAKVLIEVLEQCYRILVATESAEADTAKNTEELLEFTKRLSQLEGQVIDTALCWNKRRREFWGIVDADDRLTQAIKVYRNLDAIRTHLKNDFDQAKKYKSLAKKLQRITTPDMAIATISKVLVT